MTWLVFITLAALLFFVGLQIIWAWQFASLYPPDAKQPAPDEWPKVAVLLSLRGADPSLADCLHGLLTLNYPRYTIFVTVDSETDPAWELLHRIIAPEDLPRFEIRVLKQPSRTCTLKMSALLQRLDELDDSYQVVALIDADANPHADWLHDMVTPFADSNVGMVSGIRWFIPESPGWGSLMRSVWNAAASTYMVVFGIPWGGSLAFRAEFIRNRALQDKWSRSFCEDVSAVDILAKTGMQLRFAPSATMINTETADIRPCMRFIRRQVVCVSLYHPRWLLMAGLTFCTTLALLWTEVLLVMSCAWQSWIWAGTIAGVLVAVSLIIGATLALADKRIRRLAQERDVPVAPFSWKVLIIGPLTIVLYTIAMIWGMCSRRVDWRGITYEIAGPLEIRMTEYQPYVSKQADSHKPSSVI